MKAFYRHRIPELCEKIVDIDIFVTSRPMPRNDMSHSSSDNFVSLSFSKPEEE